MNAYTEIQTMRPRGREPFERIYLYCPKGHECGSTPLSTATGSRWASGDFSGAFCGDGPCDWEDGK